MLRPSPELPETFDGIEPPPFEESAELTDTNALDVDGLADEDDCGVPASLCKREWPSHPDRMDLDPKAALALRAFLDEGNILLTTWAKWLRSMLLSTKFHLMCRDLKSATALAAVGRD